MEEEAIKKKVMVATIAEGDMARIAMVEAMVKIVIEEAMVRIVIEEAMEKTAALEVATETSLGNDKIFNNN